MFSQIKKSTVSCNLLDYKLIFQLTSFRQQIYFQLAGGFDIFRQKQMLEILA